MKKNIVTMISIVLAVSVFNVSAEGSEGLKKFIKGDLTEKTAAVREASVQDAPVLACTAIRFVLDNKSILGDDRDLAALAVAGVLAVPDTYTASLSDEENVRFSTDMYTLFSSFTDETVKIAVLNKMVRLDGTLDDDAFVEALNTMIGSITDQTASSPVTKAVIIALGQIGNEQSFEKLYACLNNKTIPSFEPELQTSLSSLADKALPEILAIIQNGDIRTIRPLFDFIEKNAKNQSSLKAEIAENILLRTIYIAGKSPDSAGETVSLQMDSFRVLTSLNWTRSAATVNSFFDQAETEYKNGVMQEADFQEVIAGSASLSPVDASQKLSAYLSEINKMMETGGKVSLPVVRTLIKQLGDIGNKSAFDALLAVTYLTYPEDIITAARDSLARLKW